MLEKSDLPYDTMSEKSVCNETKKINCCGCIPIRIGCFILGYTSLILHSMRTIILIGMTVCVGIRTNGFDHIDPIVDGEQVAVLQDRFRTWDHQHIQMMGFVLVFATICDVISLAINIACLVGIHKKRPGPIRVYVGFATFRLVLAMIIFIFMYLNSSYLDKRSIIKHCLGLVLSAYFIVVYYIYAISLERENRQKEVADVQENNIAYIYPKLDEKLMVV